MHTLSRRTSQDRRRRYRPVPPAHPPGSRHPSAALARSGRCAVGRAGRTRCGAHGRRRRRASCGRRRQDGKSRRSLCSRGTIAACGFRRRQRTWRRQLRRLRQKRSPPGGRSWSRSSTQRTTLRRRHLVRKRGRCAVGRVGRIRCAVRGRRRRRASCGRRRRDGRSRRSQCSRGTIAASACDSGRRDVQGRESEPGSIQPLYTA